MKHVPNALTLLRLVLAPVIAWLYWTGLDPVAHHKLMLLDEPKLDEAIQSMANNLTLAAALFVVAALTDLFDGMIARAFDAHSKFGRLIDPIADKALVGLPLIVIAIAFWQSNHPGSIIAALAAGVIIIRDTAMTLVRLTARDGEGARVSTLAKWKTALELLVVGSHLLMIAADYQLWAHREVEDRGYLLGPTVWLWLTLLVITAALSAYTALQYLRPKR